jgi:sulfite exporter TauE/SafE
MGLTGSFVNTAGRLAGVQNGVPLVTGSLMILMGLSIMGVAGGVGFIEKHNSFILKALKVVIEGESPWKYYPFGLLLGFLPCGLSYSIFIGAAGTGSMFSGMVFTFCFGIGTVPALLLFGMIIGWLGHGARGIVYRAGGVVVIAMGIYYLVRGIRNYA